MLGTYPLDVRRTPNEADSDMTLPRWCYQGEITKKNLKVIMAVYIIWAKF